jgi:carbamoyltransferase
MLEDDFTSYLKTTYPSPYMTLVAEVLEEKKDKIPAVVHIDGTARYQTVNKKQNFKIYNLLKKFKEITGESVLINTSFNQHNEPIVEKPEDAIKMFLATDIDYLVIGDYLVSKDRKYLKYKFDENYYKSLFEKQVNQAKNHNIR